MRRELHLAVRTAKAPWLLAASILVLGLACAACSSGRAAPGDATASAAVPSAAATTTASPTYSTMHPPLTPCQNTGNIVGPTSRALYDVHGHSSACLGNLAGAIILQVEGAPSADARPGYIVCSPPPTDPDDYCGAGMHGPVSEVSNVDHWQFYPFPAPDVTEASRWVNTARLHLCRRCQPALDVPHGHVHVHGRVRRSRQRLMASRSGRAMPSCMPGRLRRRRCT